MANTYRSNLLSLKASGIKPPFGTPLSYSNQLAQRLLGAWLFNEGGNRVYNSAPFLSGPDTGSFINNTKFAFGPNGLALYFDGTDDAVNLSYLTYLPPHITILAGINRLSTGTNKIIFSCWDTNSTSNQCFYFSFSTSDLLSWSTRVATSSRTLAGSTVVNSNTYNVVGASIGPLGKRLYLNGKLDNAGSYTAVDNNTPTYLLAGGFYTSTLATIAQDWQGYIDFIYFFNGQLSDSEVQLLSADPWQLFETQPIWFGGADAVDVEVTATCKSLEIATYGAGVNAETNVQAALAEYEITTFGAGVNAETNVQAALAEYKLTTYGAGVNAETNVQTSAKSLILTKYNPTVEAVDNVSATVVSLKITTYDCFVDPGNYQSGGSDLDICIRL